MRPNSSSLKRPAKQVVKDIRRATRRHFSAEDKIRIVLDGLRGDDSIAALICPHLSGPKSRLFWIVKEIANAIEEAQAGGDYRQAA